MSCGTMDSFCGDIESVRSTEEPSIKLRRSKSGLQDGDTNNEESSVWMRLFPSRSNVSNRSKKDAEQESDDDTASLSITEKGKNKTIDATVFMISGCKDTQTSADVGNVGGFSLPSPNGKAGGACTSALLSGTYHEDIFRPRNGQDVASDSHARTVSLSFLCFTVCI